MAINPRWLAYCAANGRTDAEQLKYDRAQYLYVYHIAKKGERKFWTNIGKATFNRDGSIEVAIELNSVPEGGLRPNEGEPFRLHLRKAVSPGT